MHMRVFLPPALGGFGTPSIYLLKEFCPLLKKLKTPSPEMC